MYGYEKGQDGISGQIEGQWTLEFLWESPRNSTEFTGFRQVFGSLGLGVLGFILWFFTIIRSLWLLFASLASSMRHVLGFSKLYCTATLRSCCVRVYVELEK